VSLVAKAMRITTKQARELIARIGNDRAKLDAAAGKSKERASPWSLGARPTRRSLLYIRAEPGVGARQGSYQVT
jgi:hypothetical protein